MSAARPLQLVTADDSGAGGTGRVQFYERQKLGAHQALTPEGFLVITDVPMCRTADLIYDDREPVMIAHEIQGDDQHKILVHRSAEDVFHPNHIASFVGKPVVNEHPEDMQGNRIWVVPDNWRDLTVGMVLNPRRGAGADEDALLADLIIYDADVIAEIRAGKREVSCGYNADYEVIRPGEGRQINFIANHLALVESGRCGSRCAIGDRRSEIKSATDGGDMGKRPSWLDKLRAAFKSKDEAAMAAALAEAPTTDDDPDAGGGGEETHVHVHGAEGGVSRDEFSAHQQRFEQHVTDNAAEHASFHERLSKLEGGGESATADDEETKQIEGELKEEAPAGTGDKAIRATDSAYLADSFQETLAGAEILAPGIKVPTYDKAAKPKATFDAVCALRRAALTSAYADSAMRPIIEQLNGGRALTLDGMSCGAVRALFRGAVVTRKTMNTDSGRRVSTQEDATRGGAVKGAIRTPADLNKKNAEFWAGRQ